MRPNNTKFSNSYETPAGLPTPLVVPTRAGGSNVSVRSPALNRPVHYERAIGEDTLTVFTPAGSNPFTSGFAPRSSVVGRRLRDVARVDPNVPFPSENERDDGQNDEHDDEPLGDLHAESGDPACTENARDDREYQK